MSIPIQFVLGIPVAFFVISIAGIMSMLLMGIGLLISQPKSQVAQLFFLISLCSIAYIISVMGFHSIDPAYRVDYSDFDYLVRIAPNAVPGLFMILCHRVFRENSKFPKWLLVVFAIQLALSSAWQVCFVILEKPPTFTEISLISDYLIPATSLLLLGVAATGLYWSIHGWRDDLVESRRKLRGLILGILGSMIFAVTVSENFYVTTDASFVASQQITIIAIAMFGVLTMLVLSKYDYALIGGEANPGTSLGLLETDMALDLDHFYRKFEAQRLYANSGLTIAKLARQLKIPEYRLRQLINKKLGYRNFSAMLHAYRIKDICLRLADVEQRNTPILSIALDTGYKSITSFNTTFRDLKGITPSEYRKKNLSQLLRDTHQEST